MKNKLLLLLGCLLLTTGLYAQNFGIGTNNPLNKLHVKTTADPVKFEGLQSAGAGIDSVLVTDPTTGVIKYRKLGTAAKADTADFWRVKGNYGTTAPTSVGTAVSTNNYWGTADAQNLAVGSNAVTRAIFDQNGNIYGGDSTFASATSRNSFIWGKRDSIFSLSGLVDSASAVFGTLNKNYNPNSLVTGYNNVDSSSNSLVFGLGNILGAGTTGTTQTNRGTIVGGGGNMVVAGAGGASYNSIVNGSGNTVSGACFESIVTGFQNTVTNSQKMYVGGQQNTVINANYSFTHGFFNSNRNAHNLVFGGGLNANANSQYSTLLGHSSNVDASYSLSMGRGHNINTGANYSVTLGQNDTVAANHNNSFAFGTSATTTAASQFVSNFSGGHRFYVTGAGGTAGTPSMNILTSGNVGINNATPANRLHVTAAADPVRFEGLQSVASGIDSVLVTDPATGVIRYRRLGTAAKADTADFWKIRGNSGTTAGTNFIGTTDARDFVTKTNNTEAMRVTTAGRVGIGTTTPTALTEISTTGNVNTNQLSVTTTGTNDRVLVGFANTAGGGGNLSFRSYGPFYSETLFGTALPGGTAMISLAGTMAIGNYTNNPLILGANNAEALRISAAGNIGINNTAPANKLHVIAASDPVRFQGLQSVASGVDSVLVTDPTTGVIKYRKLGTAAKADTADFWRAKGNYGTTPGTNFIGTVDAQDFVTKTNNTEVMRVTSAGKVGIGTASPTYNLDVFNNVNGNVVIRANNSNAGSSAASILTLGNDASANGAYMFLTSSTYTGGAGGNSLNIAMGADRPIAFFQGGAERMRINTGGNLGIGNIAPSNKLHVTAASDPVRFEGLQSVASGVDSVLVTDPTTGVIKYRKLGTAAKADTADSWRVKGNYNTTAPTTVGTAVSTNNYWGTADARNLAVGTNSLTRAIFDQYGNVYGGDSTFASATSKNSFIWGKRDSIFSLSGQVDSASAVFGTLNKNYNPNSLVAGYSNIDSSANSFVFGTGNILGAGTTGTTQTNRGTIVGGGGNSVVAGTGGATYNAIINGSGNAVNGACFEGIITGFINTVTNSQKAYVGGQQNTVINATGGMTHGFSNSNRNNYNYVFGAGLNANANAQYSTVLGTGSNVDASYALSAGGGLNINTGANYSVALGQNNTVAANHNNAMAIGTSATTAAANQFVSNFSGGHRFYVSGAGGTAGTPSMTILPSGNVGINNAAPTTRLSVGSGDVYFGTQATPSIAQLAYGYSPNDGIYFQNTPNAGVADGAIIVQRSGNSLYPMYLSRNGSIGVANGGFIQFWVNNAGVGSIFYNGVATVYGTTSDVRLKNNIKNTHYSLADLMKIEVKDYNYKTDSTKSLQTGFLAQQLYDVFPNAVVKGGNDAKKDPWLVDYGRLAPLVVKAVQELKEENDVVKAKNAALENQLAGMQKDMQDLSTLKKQLEQLQVIVSKIQNENANKPLQNK